MTQNCEILYFLQNWERERDIASQKKGDSLFMLEKFAGLKVLWDLSRVRYI